MSSGFTGQTLGTLVNSLDAPELGCRFTVGPNPLYVSQVGLWNVAGNTSNHTIYLGSYSSLLGSASVTFNGAGTNQYIYANLTATLLANTAYYLTFGLNGGDYYYHDNTTVTISPDLASIDQSSYSLTNGDPTGTYNYNIMGNHIYGPLNFVYSLSSGGGSPLFFLPALQNGIMVGSRRGTI